MKTILVTGANGFIGKNLCIRLQNFKEVELLKYDIHDEPARLKEYLGIADVVFHLAGVNRPQNIEEFEFGNKDFTEEILQYLEENNRRVTMVLTSSIQAALDNPYGNSKRSAEEAVFSWSKKTANKAFVYRLPNVFGKWCKPNYNSAVATFCHNLANKLPIQINDPNAILNLVYIDDLVHEFCNLLKEEAHTKQDSFSYIPTEYKINLQALADILTAFADNRNTLMMPNMENPLVKKLYATYVSYIPKDNISYELDMKHDHRGWLAEFIKTKQFGQIFVSKTKPGIARGNHWHHTKAEKFLVLDGNASIKLRKIDTNEVVEYIVSGDVLQVVDIPTGYTHNITNIGEKDLVTLFWADEIFDMENPDTTYVEV